MVLHRFFGVAEDPDDIIKWVYRIMPGEPFDLASGGEDPCLLFLFKGEDALQHVVSRSRRNGSNRR
jgi:hypothetical protein